MCVQPVIIEVLGLWNEVRRTCNSKALLGFLPPYYVFTAEKNLEDKSLKSKYKYMEFHHCALRIILKDLLQLENIKNGLEVDIPGMGTCFLRVHLAFVVGDIKGQNPMECLSGYFSSNVCQILPSCECPYSKYDVCLEFKCSPVDKVKTDQIIDRCIDIITKRLPRLTGQARLDLAETSKIRVVSAFRDFSFYNSPMGMYGALPIETLHAWMD
jgi:hypothetical protein